MALDLDPALPPIVTDAERLRIALVNILANARHAVQARAAGGRSAGGAALLNEPGVIVRTTYEDGHVSISIRDQGVGITPEDMAHIFDPYFTTRRAGTGLGLPISKNIIDGLGGSIHITSRIGSGTEIRVDLPLRAVAAA